MNETFDIDENHYISYLPKSNYCFERTAFAMDPDTMSETALVTREPWTCLILNGDFRDAYNGLIGYEACFEFFMNQPKELRSSWSDWGENP
jgi:hypothetical protein